MDAVYIEQLSKEENLHSGGDKNSVHDSSTNLENSSFMSDTQEMVLSSNKDKMMSQPSVIVCGDQPTEPSVTSDLDEPSILVMDSNRQNASPSSNESVHEQVCDWSEMFSQEKDAMDEGSGIKNRDTPEGISEKPAEEGFGDKSSKDEECKLLREEVGICK